jgi:hypothetical protein
VLGGLSDKRRGRGGAKEEGGAGSEILLEQSENPIFCLYQPFGKEKTMQTVRKIIDVKRLMSFIRSGVLYPAALRRLNYVNA